MSSTDSKQSRRHDLDWLRVLAMLNIFIFHSARAFDHMGWHIKFPDPSMFMTGFVDLTSRYIMPLFFVISAVSSYFSLNSRSGKEYLFERTKRLIVPLVFGSVVVIAPVQVWIERVTQSDYTESFLHFYLHDYFKGFYMFGGNFAWMGIHLWYLLVLFIFTLLTHRLFRLLLRDRPRRVASGLAEFCQRPGALFVFVIPIFLIELLVNLQPDGVGMRDAGGWSLITYLVVFIVGYVLALDSGFFNALERYRFVSLVVAIILSVLFVAEFYLKLFSFISSAGYVMRCLANSALMWSCLAAILGFGRRHLDFSNRFLVYANRAVLPFYVLHQTVIVCFAFLVRDWRVGTPIKYPVIVIGSFTIIMLIYELVVRRIKPLGFLFGMKA